MDRNYDGQKKKDKTTKNGWPNIEQHKPH
jgi:hypothetical protein